MKISISYPPLESEKGTALLSQNRQFQWFNHPTYIYPMVPASTATLLQENGYDVFWDDGIAEEISYKEWFERIKKEAPDMIIIESKTPVIKRHWKIVNELKDALVNSIVVLIGDHVTGMPEESLENCKIDYVVTGGNYDFSLLELANFIAKKDEYTELPFGIYTKNKEEIIKGKKTYLVRDLNLLPTVDRDLTKWKMYSEKNGNFKYLPGTYTMAGRDCWWGKCTFCSWTTLHPGDNFKTVTPTRLLDEIGVLIEKYGVKEIFDDSGCFPHGTWLKEFCNGMIERGYNKKVVMGCNMRVGALNQEEWNLMSKANFRFILIGLESMNQSTLDRLDKGVKIKDIEPTMKMAQKAGLDPHITTMVGYPWETKVEATETINFAKRLFVEGSIDSLQATIVVPYPGTPMFKEAKENGWLLTEDWDRYDMRESVWKSEVGTEDVKLFSQELYKAALTPSFIFRKVIGIRSLDDFMFLFRTGLKVLGHLKDFAKVK
jgi:anaerobic magnesium-protoporphyrin IX monomethyl ester cyclase